DSCVTLLIPGLIEPPKRAKTERASWSLPFRAKYRGDSGMYFLSSIIRNPVGKPNNHKLLQLYVGSRIADAPEANKYPAPVPNPPSATRVHPRCRDGTVSAIRANVIGSNPPADNPIKKHMAKFHPNDGIAPHIDVPINIRADNKIVARRPY